MVRSGSLLLGADYKRRDTSVTIAYRFILDSGIVVAVVEPAGVVYWIRWWYTSSKPFTAMSIVRPKMRL